MKAILTVGGLAALFLWGGPLVGFAISSVGFTLPVLFIVAIVGLAVWKITDLFARHER
jgi:hypothetical protein